MLINEADDCKTVQALTKTQLVMNFIILRL